MEVLVEGQGGWGGAGRRGQVGVEVQARVGGKGQAEGCRLGPIRYIRQRQVEVMEGGASCRHNMQKDSKPNSCVNSEEKKYKIYTDFQTCGTQRMPETYLGGHDKPWAYLTYIRIPPPYKCK